MTDRHEIEQWLAEYLTGETDAERRRELKQRLLEAGIDETSLAEWEAFSEDLESIPAPQPTSAMTDGFYEKLEAFKTARAPRQAIREFNFAWIGHLISKERLPRYAYAFCLLILGWFAGYWLTPSRDSGELNRMTAEMQSIKEMVTLTLLEQPSPAERVRAVGMVGTLDETDARVIDALLKTLDGDPNINVRIVTVETLSRFAHIPRVREGLIRSIARQDAPIVQLALADLMVALGERRSAEAFQELLTRSDLKYAVKTRLESSLARL